MSCITLPWSDFFYPNMLINGTAILKTSGWDQQPWCKWDYCALFRSTTKCHLGRGGILHLLSQHMQYFFPCLLFSLKYLRFRHKSNILKQIGRWRSVHTKQWNLCWKKKNYHQNNANGYRKPTYWEKVIGQSRNR